jgi:hypothetical protein
LFQALILPAKERTNGQFKANPNNQMVAANPSIHPCTARQRNQQMDNSKPDPDNQMRPVKLTGA